MNCYHEFKIRYLKNQKLFSIIVHELFEPIFLRKKKAIGFYGDFTVTNAKLGREICI